MTRPRIGLFALLAAIGGGACTSRTVPLPPPGIESVSAVSAGLTVVRGVCEEGASVAVLNETSARGVLLSSDETGCGNSCPFEAELAAEPGDNLRIWQFRGSTNPVFETVPEP